MNAASRAAAVLVLGAAALRVAVARPDDARAPVPDAAARTPVAAAVRKEFRDDLKSKDPAVRRKLVRTLMDRAAATKDDPLTRYVLLDEAANVAEDVRDVPLALEVARALGASFQVQPVALGVASVDAITRNAKDAVVLSEGASACVELAGEALAANDASTASGAVAAARKLAASAKLGGLAARAGELADLVGAFRRQSAASDAAAAALAATPDDPAANEAAGRFLAFGRGDWAAGLPHLAKCADAALKDAAARDSAGREVAGDAWWQAAQKEKDPLAKARMLARAASFYAPADGAAPGDEAQRRVDSITWLAWSRGIALTKDFSKSGPAGLALATIRAYAADQHVNRNASEWRTKLPRFPEVAFDRGVEYLWTLVTTHGDMTLRLFADTAPKHVANVIYLTELGFYDGLTFHRVIPGFMAQGGAVNRDGTGGPGYGFATEFLGNRKHDRAGVLSMANTGEPNSDSSQFFILFAPATHLDGKHTIFGELVGGMDTLKKLEDLGSPEGRTRAEIGITSARITVR